MRSLRPERSSDRQGTHSGHPVQRNAPSPRSSQAARELDRGDDEAAFRLLGELDPTPRPLLERAERELDRDRDRQETLLRVGAGYRAARVWPHALFPIIALTNAVSIVVARWMWATTTWIRDAIDG